MSSMSSKEEEYMYIMESQSDGETDIAVEEERMRSNYTFDQQSHFEITKWIHIPAVYRSLIENGFKITEELTSEEIQYLIKKLCEDNKLDTLEMMLQNGLKPSWRCQKFDYQRDINISKSAMEVAMEHINDDQLDVIKCFIKAGWNCENEHCYGSQVLTAVKRKLKKVLAFLLEIGAKFTNNVLIEAGKVLDKELIQILLQNKTSRYPYFSALIGVLDSIFKEQRISQFTACFNWLLDHLVRLGMKINSHTLYSSYKYRKNTIAEIVVDMHFFPDVEIPKLLEILKKHGLKLDACCIKHNSLMEVCVKRLDRKHTLKYLLDQGLDPNVKGMDGVPLLHLTLRLGDGSGDTLGKNDQPRFIKNGYSRSGCNKSNMNHDAFGLFIQKGIDVNQQDSKGISMFEILFSHEVLFEQYLMYMVVYSETRIKLAKLKINRYDNKFSKFSFAALAILILGGCRYPALMNAGWLQFMVKPSRMHVGEWKKRALNHQSRAQLLSLADPLFFQLKYHPNESLHHDASREFPLLQTWCVYAVHRHLYQNVTRGKSIIPRLTKLAVNLPKALAKLLTFSSFLEQELDIPPSWCCFLVGEESVADGAETLDIFHAIEHLVREKSRNHHHYSN